VTVIYGTEGSLPEWGYQQGLGGFAGGTTSELVYPYPLPGAVQATYLNKCIDGVTGQWHLWQTFFQDRQGVYYKSSGGQQFDAATYKVETIVHGREQI